MPRRRAPALVADGLVAGALAALASGAPSTIHALASRRDPLEAALAAGSLVCPDERRTLPLAAAAVPTHLALSLCWGIVLAVVLPARRTVAAGALAGLAIAALDLSLGRRFRPRIRALAPWPQVADHVAYGALTGAAVAWRRRRRGPVPGRPCSRTSADSGAEAHRRAPPG